jgi:SNF2 family DNA or RNA helicase
MVNFPKIIRCVLILCPVNTIKNWVEEFDKWLEGDLMDKIGQVYDGSIGKSLWDRAQRTNDWMKRGDFATSFKRLVKDS